MNRQNFLIFLVTFVGVWFVAPIISGGNKNYYVDESINEFIIPKCKYEESDLHWKDFAIYVAQDAKELGIVNIKPIISQAILESSYFKSKLTKENNNIFGLKEPKSRPTTAKGTKNGHAYYDSIQDCILDMYYYQTWGKVKLNDKKYNHSEYFNVITKVKKYAEDNSYKQKNLKLIQKTQKEFFEELDLHLEYIVS